MVSQDYNLYCSTDVFDKVTEIARAAGKAPGDCVKCANDILKAFQQAGISARKVELLFSSVFLLIKLFFLKEKFGYVQTGILSSINSNRMKLLLRQDGISQWKLKAKFTMLSTQKELQ
jgi:hypothetical protein